VDNGIIIPFCRVRVGQEDWRYEINQIWLVILFDIFSPFVGFDRPEGWWLLLLALLLPLSSSLVLRETTASPPPPR
jgi:hypothetical protein